MHENERFSLAALEVVERGLIDFDRSDVRATRFRSRLSVAQRSAQREESDQRVLSTSRLPCQPTDQLHHLQPEGSIPVRGGVGNNRN
jgi:hypothetical protein